MTTWEQLLAEIQKKEEMKEKWWEQAKKKERYILLERYLNQCG